jgi:hypothetical protein
MERTRSFPLQGHTISCARRCALASSVTSRRSGTEWLNAGAVELLRSKGMIVNETDTREFRKQLGAFYARWKAIYGDKAWSLFEARVGKLVWSPGVASDPRGLPRSGRGGLECYPYCIKPVKVPREEPWILPPTC